MWKNKNFKGVINKFEKACMSTLNDAMEATGDYIDNNEVPHDTGQLAKSKTIMDDPNDVKVWIGYGGGGLSPLPKLPYAKRWHEHPANFQKGRKHNYLRDPMKNKFPTFLKRALELRGLIIK